VAASQVARLSGMSQWGSSLDANGLKPGADVRVYSATVQQDRLVSAGCSADL